VGFVITAVISSLGTFAARKSFRRTVALAARSTKLVVAPGRPAQMSHSRALVLTESRQTNVYRPFLEY
jgi:hypothetical protein